MDVSLKIKIEQAQGKVPVTVFRLSGWLDAQSEGEFGKAASDAIQKGARNMVLDLSELDMITSAGMRAIQKIYKQLTPESESYKTSRLKLCNAPPKIYNILGTTGFLLNIPNYESLQTAVDSFSD